MRQGVERALQPQLRPVAAQLWVGQHGEHGMHGLKLKVVLSSVASLSAPLCSCDGDDANADTPYYAIDPSFVMWQEKRAHSRWHGRDI